MIVNESMARATWPGESAIGKCIRIGFDPDFDPATATGPPVPSAAVPCREVIGVAHDIRQRSVLPADSEDRLMQYFVPFSQVPKPPFIPNPGPRIGGLMLRVTASAGALAPSIRRLIVNGRTDLPFVRVRQYSQLLDRQMRPWQIGTALLGLFSALAREPARWVSMPSRTRSPCAAARWPSGSAERAARRGHDPCVRRSRWLAPA